VEPETPHDIPAAVLLQSVPQNATTSALTIQNLCSLIRETAANSETREVLIDTPNNGRAYRMKVTKLDDAGGKNGHGIRYFAELAQPGTVSVRDKFELALRLSLAIAQLCETPWVNGPWKCNDVCVTQAIGEDAADASNNKFPVIFILREMYSVAYEQDGASQLTAVETNEVARILDDEPALTTLGLALIELAVGKHKIQAMKAEYNVDSIGNDDLADLATAKRMLKEGLIRKEASAMYEGVVDACLHRRYTDNGGNLRSFLSGHGSFFSSFREAIILPLFEVLKRYDI